MTDQPIRVLLLEDSAPDADLIQAHLGKLQVRAEVVVAGDRGEYLAALHVDGYDVILADYSLPGFDGVSALDIARQQAPETPFIFVSGVLGEEIAVESFKKGAADYVLKQRLNRLPAAVERALDQAAERRERRRTENALSEQEARYRALVEALGTVVWTTLPDGRVVDMPQWRTLTGQTAEAVRGFGWLDAIHTDDRAAVDGEWRRAVASRSTYDIEYRLRRADGVYRWYNARGVPVLNGRGEVREWIGVCIDIDDRKRAEEALRDSESRFSAALTIAELGTFDWNVRTGAVLLDARSRAIFGFGPEEGRTVDAVFDRIHPDDVQRVRAEAEASIQTLTRLTTEYRIRLPNGAERTVISINDAVPGTDRKAERMFGVFGDISERKAAEDHLKLLVNELNHRVKNNLATVQAIASQTLRGVESLPQARQAFMSRLMALASAHDILTRERWERAQLSEVAEGALTHCAGGSDRLHVEGPPVSLPAKTALAVSMALHELCTNAVKYGALSVPEGRVHLAWRIEDAAEPRLHMMWSERGGPPVTPPESRGFGSRLLERALAAELHGRVEIDFRPSGVVCTVEAPLPDEPAAG